MSAIRRRVCRCGRFTLEDVCPLCNAKLAQELEEREHDSAERQEAMRVLRAVRLSPSLEICEALLRGEKVPRSRLDPEWVARYGL